MTYSHKEVKPYNKTEKKKEQIIIMPLISDNFSKDTDAYRYLPLSIEAFPQGEVMQKALFDSGFSKAEFRRYTGGICTFYLAEK